MTEIHEEKIYKEKQSQTHKNKAESTRQVYLKIASNFLLREVDSKNLKRNSSTVCSALYDWGETVQNNTYRKMQCALEYYCYTNNWYATAKLIRDTKKDSYGEVVKKKQRICKSIKEEEHQKLLMASKRKGDSQLSAALILAYHTGTRPCEMCEIEYDTENDLTLYIMGAKKDANGLRSIDKELSLKLDEQQKREVMNSVDALYGMDSKQLAAMKSRMSRLTRKVFPSRKYPPTLYSYRHQIASDLKRSKKSGELSLKECSAVLSHRSQQSIQGYGNFNSSGGLNRGIPIPSEESVRQVNDDYTESAYKMKLNAEYEPTVDNDEQGESESMQFLRQQVANAKNRQSSPRIRVSRHHKDNDYSRF